MFLEDMKKRIQNKINNNTITADKIILRENYTSLGYPRIDFSFFDRNGKRRYDNIMIDMRFDSINRVEYNIYNRIKYLATH